MKVKKASVRVHGGGSTMAKLAVEPYYIMPTGRIRVDGVGFPPNSPFNVFIRNFRSTIIQSEQREVVTDASGYFSVVLQMAISATPSYPQAVAIDAAGTLIAGKSVQISEGGDTYPSLRQTIALRLNGQDVPMRLGWPAGDMRLELALPDFHDGDELTIVGTRFTPNQQIYVQIASGSFATGGSITGFRSDSGGSFEVSTRVSASWPNYAPPYNVSIWAWDEDYRVHGYSNQILFTVQTGAPPSAVNVIVEVRDSQDFPVVGATVTLGSSTGTTDVSGRATLSLTSTGTFTLTVSAPGFTTLTKPISITGPSTIPVNLSGGEQTRTVIASVLVTGGFPLPDVTASLIVDGGVASEYRFPIDQVTIGTPMMRQWAVNLGHLVKVKVRFENPFGKVDIESGIVST